jgi:ABC-2 type transport system ATP-binding protein
MESEEPLVVVRDLGRRFGAKAALDGVSLEIRPGTVLGLVGENGAGKTTLIKHLLGLLKAQTGSVRVFGRDPVADPAGVLSRIGYLSEDADLPGWMRVSELMRYSMAFYPAWDAEYAERLRGEFGLDPQARIKELSKGQRARAGLLVALAYRPELLILDEPSSGLDPLVRRDILTAIIRTIADEGRTVLFSSHLLSEVERVADQVAMIRDGRMVFCDTLDHLKETHCRLTLRFPAPRETAPNLDGALLWEGAGCEWTAFCQGSPAQLEGAAALLGAEVVRRNFASLDEIFVAQATTAVGSRG